MATMWNKTFVAISYLIMVKNIYFPHFLKKKILFYIPTPVFLLPSRSPHPINCHPLLREVEASCGESTKHATSLEALTDEYSVSMLRKLYKCKFWQYRHVCFCVGFHVNIYVEFRHWYCKSFSIFVKIICFR